MEGWLEEIPYRSASGLSIDRSHIKCDVCKTCRSLGMINIIQPYDIVDWKTCLGTTGHEEIILARKEQEQREVLSDDIPNNSEQQHLILASFFTVKGTGSRFAQKVLRWNY